MTETPRPEKWATIRRLHLNAPYGSSPAGQYWYEPDAQPIVAAYEKALAEGDAARAADAARHQQAEERSIAAEQQAFMLATRIEQERQDAATLRATVDQQAETIHQLQATLPELHDAIERQSAQIATLTQERDEARAESTRNVLRYTVRGFTAGENADSKAWRARAEAAEARCATLTAALKTARGYVVERLAQANKYDGPPRSGFVDYDLQQIDAALAAAPQGGSTK